MPVYELEVTEGKGFFQIGLPLGGYSVQQVTTECEHVRLTLNCPHVQLQPL